MRLPMKANKSMYLIISLALIIISIYLANFKFYCDMEAELYNDEIFPDFIIN